MRARVALVLLVLVASCAGGGDGAGAGAGEGEGEALASTCGALVPVDESACGGCPADKVCRLSECATTQSTCVDPVQAGGLCVESSTDASERCGFDSFRVACAVGLDCSVERGTDQGGEIQSVCVAPASSNLGFVCGCDRDCAPGLLCSAGLCVGCDADHACSGDDVCTQVCGGPTSFAVADCRPRFANAGDVCDGECSGVGIIERTCVQGLACNTSCTVDGFETSTCCG